MWRSFCILELRLRFANWLFQTRLATTSLKQQGMGKKGYTAKAGWLRKPKGQAAQTAQRVGRYKCKPTAL